ncbi:hypothetical protein GPECTOR_70g524 [Gonium pectorale]|uniref:RNA polymerase sigma-70 region 2 domain-containing protein n=1 Tax=Gonium pectorale TaxID=33097 RepID=A0A150G3A0_GONPE|nr:hypothetical protein GPECTOR_70g524 [Gonium pectorale]|eukprot:KXZ44293.1 hypothetical protein GPECTOR_70g524 [Gonium pectorale]
MFLGTFTKDRILSSTEEQDLAAAAQDYMRLEEYSRVLTSLLRRRPSMQEMAEALKTDPGSLAVRLDCGNRARSTLAQKNYRLVVSIAKRMVRPNASSSAAAAGGGGGMVTLEDALTAGMDGLMRAIQKFDASSGFKLSTYATWWIRQYITRYMQTQQAVVNIPSSLRAHVDKLNRVRAALTAGHPLQRPPTREELAVAAGMTVARVEELEAMWTNAAAGVRSFEAPLSDGEPGRTVTDLMSQEVRGLQRWECAARRDDEEGLGEGSGTALSVDSEEHYAMRSGLAATVDSLLASLDERDQEAVRLSYGLEEQAPEEQQQEEGFNQARCKSGEKGAGAGAAAAMKVPSGKGRLKLTNTKAAWLLANKAIKKLQQAGPVDVPHLADLLSAAAGRGNLPVRTPGYAKKSS